MLHPPQNKHVVVIGAGIGGLTAAALLLKSGFQVTVLEAHIYPGGSAGTFFHKGYQFDAGATLAGGFFPGGPHERLGKLLELTWPVKAVDPAWVVHMPGLHVTQWSDRNHWCAERQAAFPGSEPFWRTQERLAEISWQISSKAFPWPPISLQNSLTLAASLRPSMLPAAPFLFSKISDFIPRPIPPLFGTFLDAQLLISAQTTSQYANALYGSAALDLPRRGVQAVMGGMGSLAKTLAHWIQKNGGKILYRQQADQIILKHGRAAAVYTRKGLELTCDFVVTNLTPWGLAQLIPDRSLKSLKRIKAMPLPAWGAFTLYAGVPESLLPPGFPEHHQIILDPDQALGEGNSIFLSLSDPEDRTRAPQGMRAMTLSTHTKVEPWWELLRSNAAGLEAYVRRKEQYTGRVLQAAETLLPGLRTAAPFILPGTPVTFQFYTHRPLGMVGGFPQTSIFQARSPRTGIPNVWLVGDSIFPGQSTAGVTLGAMRVAAEMSFNSSL